MPVVPVLASRSCADRLWTTRTLVPEVARADRSHTGAADKGLEVALVTDVGLNRVPAQHPLVGADLLENKVKPLVLAVFFGLICVAQTLRAFGWVLICMGWNLSLARRTCRDEVVLPTKLCDAPAR